MNAKNSDGIDAWKQIKKIGKAGFTGDEPTAYERVEKMCKFMGLFIVPFGEMECFDKTINKEKKDWVYYILENYNLASEPKLENARKFVEEIIKFNADAKVIRYNILNPHFTHWLTSWMRMVPVSVRMKAMRKIT